MKNNKAMANAQQQYLKSKILTASPSELTLMLYDGIIQFCNRAITAIREKDIEKTNYNIKKAERIIGELKMTLNYKYPVAREFDIVYNYLLRRLHDANIQKDEAPLQECIVHTRTMRETWKKVMEKEINQKARDKE